MTRWVPVLYDYPDHGIVELHGDLAPCAMDFGIHLREVYYEHRLVAVTTSTAAADAVIRLLRVR